MYSLVIQVLTFPWGHFDISYFSQNLIISLRFSYALLESCRWWSHNFCHCFLLYIGVESFLFLILFFSFFCFIDYYLWVILLILSRNYLPINNYTLRSFLSSWGLCSLNISLINYFVQSRFFLNSSSFFLRKKMAALYLSSLIVVNSLLSLPLCILRNFSGLLSISFNQFSSVSITV